MTKYKNSETKAERDEQRQKEGEKTTDMQCVSLGFVS
jgi:hypothetical protein